MPNWCNNRLTVLGPADRVAEFVKKAHGPGQHYKAHRTEIEWWEKHCEDAKAAGTPLPPHPDEKDRDPTPLSFHQLVPIPDAIMAGPYDPVGIDKEHELWGVKWGAAEDHITSRAPGRVDYSYDTPWGPATTYFETVSKDWKDLLFIVSYSEEYPSRGHFALRGGRYLAEVHDRPEKLKPPRGLSEDAQSEWWRTWQTYHYERHEEFVASLTCKGAARRAAGRREGAAGRAAGRREAQKKVAAKKPAKKTAKMTVKKKKARRKAARR